MTDNITKAYTIEQFMTEIVLCQEDLEKIQQETGLTPDRVREIWKLVRRTGIPEFSTEDERVHIRSVYEVALDPEDEEEREKFPNIYLNLSKLEASLASYLIGIEQMLGKEIKLRQQKRDI